MNGYLRKTLIFACVTLLIAGAGWAGRKAYRKATERRLMAEARQYFAEHDLRNTGLCLQRVLELDPYNAEASTLIADAFEAEGNPAALSWRARAVQLSTNNVEYRFAWAQTALKMNDTVAAAQALSGLDGRAKSTATYCKLAGALAWDLHDAAAAEKYFGEALRLEPTNQTTTINLATVRLASTNEAVAAGARSILLQTPGQSPLRIPALRYLVVDAENHKDLRGALGYSQQILDLPEAGFTDRIAHLQLLQKAESPFFPVWQASLQDEARQSPAKAFALANWMLARETPTNALTWLRSLPPEVQTNLPLPLAFADCEIAVQDWSELQRLVKNQDWADADYYRLAVESLADRHLEHLRESRTAWEKSFRLASHRIDRLSRLNQFAASWHWNPERLEILEDVVSEFPKERWAADQLEGIYYGEGNTRALADLVSKLYKTSPDDNRLRNNYALICLLEKTDVPQGCRLALEAYTNAPADPFCTTTYAYSLVLQNHPEEAVHVLNGLKSEFLRIPSVAAYYGVVEAMAGNKDAARAPLRLAESSPLLPEEKEMVRLAATQM